MVIASKLIELFRKQISVILYDPPLDSKTKDVLFLDYHHRLIIQSNSLLLFKLILIEFHCKIKMIRMQ